MEIEHFFLAMFLQLPSYALPLKQPKFTIHHSRLTIDDSRFPMFVLHNHSFLPASQPVITAGNRAFRYGDGLFETMKVLRGRILLEDYHFERLFLGMKMMLIHTGYGFPDARSFSALLVELCRKNGCEDLARVRLSVFREEDGSAGFVAEASTLDEENNMWNEEGWKIGLYPYARKSMDALANLKTANYLPYVMAGLYARENGWDDALLLNAENNICDSSIANIFLVRGSEILTPALHQGCVNGVMRRHLCSLIKEEGYTLKQEEITENDLLQSEEVFLTNAVRGIRWVRSYGEKTYTPGKTFALWQKLSSTIYQ
jgi:branched-chain amino acid aminotransferase